MNTQKLTTPKSNVASEAEKETYLLFMVADDTYALHIDDILKLEKHKPENVPHIPLVGTQNQTMRGVFRFQEKCIGVFDMRELIGVHSKKEEHDKDFDIARREKELYNWINKLEESVKTKKQFALPTDHTKSEFGKWLQTELEIVRNQNILINLKKIDRLKSAFYKTGDMVNQLIAEGKYAVAKETVTNLRNREFKNIIELLDQVEKILLANMTEMMIVMKSGGRKIGVIVDELIGAERLEQQPLATNDQPEFVVASSVRNQRLRNRTENTSNQHVHIIDTQKLYDLVITKNQPKTYETELAAENSNESF